MDMADQSSPANQPGSLLAAARVAAGLSPADVAMRLKLNARQIADIEANRFDSLGLAFSRGFVRSYARLLDMDADAIVRLLPSTAERQINVASQRIPLNRKTHRVWPWLAGVLLVVVLAAPWFVYRWMSSDDGIRNNAQPVVPSTHSSLAMRPAPASRATPASAVTAPAQPAVPVSTAPAQQPDANPVTSNNPSTGPAPDSTDRPSPAVALAALPSAQAPAASVTTNHLQLVFAGDAWVSIHDDQNRVLTARLYHAGETARLDFTGKARLVIGNAAQVSASLNGQPVNLAAWTAVRVARLSLP